VSSAGKALREWIEGLCLGTVGSGYAISSGRFHLAAEDRTLETQPQGALERAVEVHIDGHEAIVERNHYDGQALVKFNCRVQVAYPLTRAGGDLVEGLTEQNGPSTLDAIRDRALTDYLDLARVFCDPDNRGLAAPSIIAIISEESYEIEEGTDRCILTIPLRIDTQIVTTSAYAP
jgi:hypothetical protein